MIKMMNLHNFKPATWQVALLLVSSVVGTASVHAAWVVEPSADLRTRYDDNVRTRSTNEESGVVTTLGAQARLRRAEEASEISVFAGADITKYSSVDSFDEDERETLIFEGRASRSFERARVNINSSFRRQDTLRSFRVLTNDAAVDEVADADDEEVLAGEDETDVTDDLITGGDVDTGSTESLVKRDQVRISPSVSFSVSPRTSVVLNYGYTSLSYDDSAAVSQFRDSKSHNVGVQWQHSLSQRDQIAIVADTSRFKPDDSLESDSHSLSAMWNRSLTPTTTLSLAVGARRTETDLFDDTGLLFNARINKRTERGAIYAILERDVYASGFGNQVENDRLTIGLRDRLSDRLSWRINARAFSTEQLSNVQTSRNRDFVQVETGLNWSISREWRVGLSYRYTWIERETDPNDVTANSIALSLDYSPARRL